MKFCNKNKLPEPFLTSRLQKFTIATQPFTVQKHLGNVFAYSRKFYIRNMKNEQTKTKITSFYVKVRKP